MSKEFQIRDGNLIASFDLENEDGDIDFCKLLKVSHGVADEIGMFVDYVATNKIIKDQSKQIADLEAKLAESEKERHEEWKTGKEWKWEWQKVNQELEKAEQDKISFAVYELSLVNGMLTDAIIEITQNETDANKLYYLEKIAKKFAEKTGGRINELKEMK